MKKVIALSIALMPFLASAQSGFTNLAGFFTFSGAFLKSATALMFAAAFFFFLWGVFQFVRAAGDEEARKTGRDHIIYGVIGLAVMASVYGLVNFLTTSAGLSTTTVTPPAIIEITNL